MTSTLPPPFRSCCSTLKLRILSPEGSETASRAHVPLLQLCLSCELHGQCANLETIVTNKKLSAGGRAVDWAWTGQLNSCPQGVLWYKVWGPARLMPSQSGVELWGSKNCSSNLAFIKTAYLSKWENKAYFIWQFNLIYNF